MGLLSIRSTPPTSLRRRITAKTVYPANRNANANIRFDPNRRGHLPLRILRACTRLAEVAEMLCADPATLKTLPTTKRSGFPSAASPIPGLRDFAGGDTLLTLGAFLDSTTCRQSGRRSSRRLRWSTRSATRLGRRHNGDTIEPNCTPQYFSTMNYLYQLRGVIPDPATGLPANQFFQQCASHRRPSTSYHLNDGLSKSPRRSGCPGTRQLYRGNRSPREPGVTPAKRHCDGSLIPVTVPPIEYVRIDTGNLSAVDWKMDNDTSDTQFRPGHQLRRIGRHR